MWFRNEKKTVEKPILLLTLAYFASHFLFIFGLGKITAFAPDEANYLNLFTKIYNNEFTHQDVEGFSSDNLLFLSLIYSPAKLLTIVGFDNLTSLRISSTIICYFAMVLLIKKAGELSILKCRQRNWIFLGFMIPTVILWTSLALRESYIFLGVVSSVFFLGENIRKLCFKNLLGLFMSCLLLAYTKNYLQLLFSASIVLAIFFYPMRNRNWSFKISVIFLICLSPNFATQEMRDVSFGNLKTIVALIAKTEDRIPESSLDTAMKFVESKMIIEKEFDNSQGQTVDLFVQQYPGNKLVSKIVDLLDLGGINMKSDVPKLNDIVSSKERPNIFSTKLTPATFSNPGTFFSQGFKIFFLPLPFQDNGTTALNLISYESFLWYPFYLLFFLVLLSLYRDHLEFNFGILVTLFFLLSISIQACIFEVNLGTAYRHRTIFLIGVLILLTQVREKRVINSNILDV